MNMSQKNVTYKIKPAGYKLLIPLFTVQLNKSKTNIK